MPAILRNLSVLLAVALCAASASKQAQPSSQPAASAAPASPAQPQDGPECERLRGKLAAMPPCSQIESPEKRDACEVNQIDTRHSMRQKGCRS